MLPTAPFGSTGHDSSRVIFGAAALAGMSQERADATLALLEPAGVNHIDTAASYGESELRLAPFLARKRERFFLATKTEDRSASEARASLERSLERMGVDRVDLIQLHNLVELDEWHVALGPGGAVEGLVAARDEGLCRFIGVTGHGTRIPGMLRRSLEAFAFDSVLFPYNYTMLQNPSYRADAEALIETCTRRGVAIQTIKSVARRRWPDEWTGSRKSWYQPIEDPDALVRAVRFVLGRPGLFLNSSSDATLLPAILEAASGQIALPSDEAMAADADELGITALFDGAELERI
jgi:aryl-alcohol dehydrogenase-like predicted oxidoreductase